MPNFDGGHYFLTVIIPVNTKPCKRTDGTVTTPINALREALNSLPTAHQSKASIANTCTSPFTRDSRTHLTRFAVIPDVAYNGRDPQNSIGMAIKGVNPVIPQPVDGLTCPFMLWAVDFDAADGSDASLNGYLEGLWTVAQAELTDVFQYCTGFDTVDGPSRFAAWIRKCQIETVMPFNDYWIIPPPFPSLSLGGLAGEVILMAVVVFAAIFIPNMIWLHWNPWLVGIFAALLGLALGVWSALRTVAKAAAKPFPTAPGSDLPSVLKSLYLQHHFMDFAIDNQGVDPAVLHANFGAFLAAHQPNQATPTQPPGVIG
jgi:hypothetical protein